MNIKLPLLLVASATALAPSAAHAAPPAPVQVSGTAMANVVTPGAVTPLRALRFGQFLQPSAAGTITIAPNSNATATGGTVGNIGIPQLAPGRGSAAFALEGSANRLFFVTLPTSATIANGTASMNVTNFTSNVTGISGRLDSTGAYTLNVGGKLNVGALQAVGNYTGTYNITVIFL
jgi:hypothetical protein